MVTGIGEVGAMKGKGTRIASISGLRGVVGDGLDPATAAEFAAAYASECVPGPIAIGHDGRRSAPVFAAAVEAAVTGTGHDALLLGPTATPTIGRLVLQAGLSGGIQISASHNPPQYNGLKFFQRKGMVLGAEEGRTLLDRWQRRDLGWAPWDALGQTRQAEDPDASHLSALLEIVDVDAIRAGRFKVVLDACHGAGGRLATRLFDALGVDSLVLGGVPDGRYDHPPEPTEHNLREFRAIVPAVGAAVGFAQDPDADRLAVIDEAGQYIGEELTLALAARLRLAQAKGPIVINLSTSMTTEKLALGQNCPVHRTPVGEINVVERMIAEIALLGGEGNGGVIDPRVGYVRDSFVAMAMILDLMARSQLPLSRLVAELPRFSMVKEQYPIPAAMGITDASQMSGLWERIAAAFPDARDDRRDGLRLHWDDRWVHVRASNTEPIVRVIAEAPTAADARELSGRIGRWLGGA
jgi:phosphomannomutase